MHLRNLLWSIDPELAEFVVMEVLFRLQNELFLDRLVSEFWLAADQKCISLSWVIAQFSKQKDRFAVHFVVEHLRHLELTKTYLFSVD